MQGMEDMTKAAAKKKLDNEAGQYDLFASITLQKENNEMPIPLPDCVDFSANERLFLERDMLGHFMTGHPIKSVNQWLQAITSHSVTRVLELKPEEEPASKSQDDDNDYKKKSFQGTPVIVGGLVTSLRIRNEKSASLVIADENSEIETSFFFDSFFENREKMLKDEILVIEGEAGIDNFTSKFIIRGKQILTLNEAIATYCTKIGFTTASTDYQQFSEQLKALFSEFGTGKARIYIHHEQDGIISNLKLGNKHKIRPSYDLIQKAQKLSSINKVIIK